MLQKHIKSKNRNLVIKLSKMMKIKLNVKIEMSKFNYIKRNYLIITLTWLKKLLFPP